MIRDKDKKMAMTIGRIENSIRRALEEPEILLRLALYGYDFKELHRAENLLNEVIQLNRISNEFGGTSRLLLETFINIKADFEQYYEQHRSVLRAMNHPEAEEILKYVYTPTDDYDRWLSHAERFYIALSTAVSQRVELLTRGGMHVNDVAKAVELLRIMRKVMTDYHRHEGHENRGMKHTEERLRALIDWYQRFVAINTIAFEEEPQTLEILGLPAYLN